MRLNKKNFILFHIPERFKIIFGQGLLKTNDRSMGVVIGVVLISEITSNSILSALGLLLINGYSTNYQNQNLSYL